MLRFAPSFICRGTAAAARRATSTATGAGPAGSGPGGSDWAAAVMLKLDTLATKNDLAVVRADVLTVLGHMGESVARSTSQALTARFSAPQLPQLAVKCPMDLTWDVGNAGGAVDAARTLCALLLPVFPGALASLLRAASALDAFGPDPSLRAAHVITELSAARGAGTPLARFMLQQPGSWPAMMDAEPELTKLLGSKVGDKSRGLLPMLSGLVDVLPVLRAAAPRTAAEALAATPLHHALDRAIVYGPAGVTLLTYLACGTAGVTPEFELDVRGGISSTPIGSTIVITAGEIKLASGHVPVGHVARSQLRALLCRAIVHHALTHHGADPATWRLRPTHGVMGAPTTSIEYGLHTVLSLLYYSGDETTDKERELGTQLAVARATYSPKPAAAAASAGTAAQGGGSALVPLPLPWPDASRRDGRGVDARCTYTVGATVVKA